jgi:hypothetical protein
MGLIVNAPITNKLVFALLAIVIIGGCTDENAAGTAEDIQFENPSFAADRVKLIEAGTISIDPLLDRLELEFNKAKPPQNAMPKASQIADILIEIDPARSMQEIDRRYDFAKDNAKFGLIVVASSIGPPHSKSFFLRVVRGEDPKFMPGALLGLQPYAAEGDVKSAFQEALHSKDKDIRRSAALVLSDNDAFAVDLLVEDATDSSLPWYVRETAIINLGTSHVPQARVALTRLSKSKEDQVRQAAQLALAGR